MIEVKAGTRRRTWCTTEATRNCITLDAFGRGAARATRIAQIGLMVLFGAVASVHVGQAAAQEPARDASMFDERVTQQSIGSTICRPDYVDTVSPPINVLMDHKSRLLAERGISVTAGVAYALDRRVPVLLGGSPDAPSNLDLLPWAGGEGERRKSRLVVRLKHCVCEGKMSLGDAQATILGSWATTYPGFSQNSCNIGGVNVATGSREGEP